MTTQWQLVDIDTKEIVATLEEPFPVLPSVFKESLEALYTGIPNNIAKWERGNEKWIQRMQYKLKPVIVERGRAGS